MPTLAPTVVNGLSSVLFFFEIQLDVPLDFHYPLFYQLLINQEAVK